MELATGRSQALESMRQLLLLATILVSRKKVFLPRHGQHLAVCGEMERLVSFCMNCSFQIYLLVYYE